MGHQDQLELSQNKPLTFWVNFCRGACLSSCVCSRPTLKNNVHKRQDSFWENVWVVCWRKRKKFTMRTWLSQKSCISPLSSVGSGESWPIKGGQFTSSFSITSPFHLPPNGQISFKVMRSCSQSKKWSWETEHQRLWGLKGELIVM